MSIAPGARPGRYEIRSKIGEGGKGEVFRAFDPSRFCRPPFLLTKIAWPDLKPEAQTAGALNHPNILAVYGVGVHDRAPHVVSELLEGETLRELLDQRQPATRKSIDYAVQLAQGVEAAQDKGLVHRDVKPDNIFITKGGVAIKVLPAELRVMRQRLVRANGCALRQSKLKA